MSSSLYRFQFSGSTVTRIEEFDDGAWRVKSPDANEVYSYNPSTNTVTETETERGITKLTSSPIQTTMALSLRVLALQVHQAQTVILHQSYLILLLQMA